MKAAMDTMPDDPMAEFELNIFPENFKWPQNGGEFMLDFKGDKLDNYRSKPIIYFALGGQWAIPENVTFNCYESICPYDTLSLIVKGRLNCYADIMIYRCIPLL